MKNYLLLGLTLFLGLALWVSNCTTEVSNEFRHSFKKGDTVLLSEDESVYSGVVEENNYYGVYFNDTMYYFRKRFISYEYLKSNKGFKHLKYNAKNNESSDVKFEKLIDSLLSH